MNNILDVIENVASAWHQALLRDFPAKGIEIQPWQVNSVHVFPQTWGSTALGFGGMGGASMSTANVVIIGAKGWATVYFGGRHAYTVPESGKLEEAIRKQRMPDVVDVKSLL